ncbi:hypothetical protein [Labilithrix luteola]|uniref:hypothetical protein n=1 Tax=Labilithrix luteola TaxID=1391654 RepID=UPI0011BAB60D|nr:hypothetical protein [Labilithrix luteola]
MRHSLSSLSIAVGVGAAAFAIAAFVGCSSDNPGSDTAAAEDSGTDAPLPPATPRPDPPRATDSGADPTLDGCLAACDTAHPAGLVKDEAIDTCWSDNCQGPCIDATGPFDGGTSDDAGDAGPLACKNDVSTGGTACTRCTEAFCCAPWDACFDDADCSGLNACRAACYSR